MAQLRSEVGFWSALGSLRVRDLVTAEAIASFFLGSGVAAVLTLTAPLAARISLAATFVGVTAALVAIVFAGLALVVALLSDDYLRLLRAGENGLLGFFRPFTLAVGVQVTTLIGAVVYGALAKALPSVVEPWIFGGLAVLFFASCLEIVVLTRSVLMHALLRSKLGEVVDMETQRGKRGA